MRYSFLQNLTLFAGIQMEDLKQLVGCLSPVLRQFERKEAIFLAGDKVTSIGIVLKGTVQVVREDFWGGRAILAHLTAGDLFAEAFACANAEALPVSVFAVEPCEVILIHYQKIITPCGPCAFHTRLIANMMRILAVKNGQLARKNAILSEKTIRDKLHSYLSDQALQAQSRAFSIPFNRQELADYLSTDRSALSKELGRMQKEGLLTFQKNHFCLTEV